MPNFFFAQTVSFENKREGLVEVSLILVPGSFFLLRTRLDVSDEKCQNINIFTNLPLTLFAQSNIIADNLQQLYRRRCNEPSSLLKKLVKRKSILFDIMRQIIYSLYIPIIEQ